MRIILTEKEYDEFVALLDAPAKTDEKLAALFAEPAPWDVTDE